MYHVATGSIGKLLFESILDIFIMRNLKYYTIFVGFPGLGEHSRLELLYTSLQFG